MAKAPVKARRGAKAVASPEPKRASKPRLTVGAELTDQEPFLGVIEIDEWADGEYGEQLHIGVKPMEFKVAEDKTGMFHEWYKPSTKITSKCGQLLASLKGIDVGNEVAVGEGDLKGIIAWFVRKDLEFGKQKDGTVLKSEQVLLAHHVATEEDVRRGTEAMKGTATAATPGTPDWTDDEITAVIKLMDGKKRPQYQVTAAKSKLAPTLKQAILSGAALEYLLSLELVEVSRAGVVTAMVADEDDEDEADQADEDEEDEEEEGEDDEDDEDDDDDADEDDDEDEGPPV